MLPFAAFLATGENAVSCVGTMGVSRRFEGCLFRGLRKTPAHRGEQPLGAVNRRPEGLGLRLVEHAARTARQENCFGRSEAFDKTLRVGGCLFRGLRKTPAHRSEWAKAYYQHLREDKNKSHQAWVFNARSS